MGRKGFCIGLGALAALAAVAFAAPAAAQADAVIEQARAQGIVGEQADGYVGVVAGAEASADIRARVDQLNIRRRGVYTQRAAQNGATASEMAAAVACQIFRGRIAVGEKYRDEGGTWRTNTASTPVAVPSFCTN
ncbi:MAG: YdbL family protein [Hyphomonadaceae bacterium]|nr:YdbL family protein [Hyphomonadaceae bacterium]